MTHCIEPGCTHPAFNGPRCRHCRPLREDTYRGLAPAPHEREPATTGELAADRWELSTSALMLAVLERLGADEAEELIRRAKIHAGTRPAGPHRPERDGLAATARDYARDLFRGRQ